MNKIELILNKAFNSDTPELQNFPITTFRQLFYKYDTEDEHTFFKSINGTDGEQLITDIEGNFMYIRHNGVIDVSIEKGNLRHIVPLRMVAGFIDCKNTFELAEGLVNVMYKYINKYLQNPLELDVNLQSVLEEETNDRYSIKKDNVALFAIDFTLQVPFSTICAVEDLICEECAIPENATCFGFPRIVIPNPL